MSAALTLQRGEVPARISASLASRYFSPCLCSSPPNDVPFELHPLTTASTRDGCKTNTREQDSIRWCLLASSCQDLVLLYLGIKWTKAHHLDGWNAHRRAYSPRAKQTMRWQSDIVADQQYFLRQPCSAVVTHRTLNPNLHVKTLCFQTWPEEKVLFEFHVGD